MRVCGADFQLRHIIRLNGSEIASYGTWNSLEDIFGIISMRICNQWSGRQRYDIGQKNMDAKQFRLLRAVDEKHGPLFGPVSSFVGWLHFNLQARRGNEEI